MNDQNLDIIINNYIEKFEEIKSGETYKWVAVQHFQNNWDINADDFGSMFKNAVAATINMVSNRVVQPTSGIIELAKYDIDSVRELFIELFADDGGDLGARQSRIDDFVARADELLPYDRNKTVYTGFIARIYRHAV